MRLDVYLVENSLTESRNKARTLITEGKVRVDGEFALKPSLNIDGQNVEIVGEGLKYVSRGALKLEAALIGFGINPQGCRCVDIGASTGGFTDCLLQFGADKVFCVDSGKDQLHNKLRLDPRVVVKEQFNARNLTKEDIGFLADIAVMDVSFISQTILHPIVAKILSKNGLFISLIKPQFEAGKEHIGKGGIVKSKEVHKKVIENVVLSAHNNGLYLCDALVSPITGGDGNVEYIACFARDSLKQNELLLSDFIAERLKL